MNSFTISERKKNLLDHSSLIIFCIMPFLEPRCIYELANLSNSYILNLLDNIFDIWRLLSAIFIFILYIFLWRKFTKIVLWVIAFQFCIFFSTMLNSGEYFAYIQTAVPIIGFVMLTEIYIKSAYTMTFFKTCYYVLSCLVIINLITILLYPDGMYVDFRDWEENWFLGYRNSHVYIFLPTIAFAYLMNLKNGRLNLQSKIIIGTIIASTLLIKSSTTLVAIVVIVFLLTFFKKKKLPRMMNIYTYLGGSIFASVGFMFFSLQNYITTFIVDILHRDVSFTSRIYIWQSAVYYIKQSFVFGYGYDSSVARDHLNNFTQAHNQYLDIFYMTGLMGFIVYILLLVIAMKQLFKYKDVIAAKILSFTLLGYFILYIVEAKRDWNAMFFVMLIIAYYLPLLMSKVVPSKTGEGG